MLKRYFHFINKNTKIHYLFILYALYYSLQTVCRDGLVLMPDLFFAVFMNSFMAVFTRQHWPRSKHHELLKVARGAMVFQRAGDDMGRALSQTPWLRHVMPEFSGYNDLREGNKCLYDFMKVSNHLEQINFFKRIDFLC